MGHTHDIDPQRAIDTTAAMSDLAVSEPPHALARRQATVPPASASALDRGDEATVFISYSRRDMAFVDRLDQQLQARAWQPWSTAPAIEVGENWFARLQDLISRAETIVFVLSPDSVASGICAQEVAYGKRLGKRFIPVVARRVETPNVPEALSELNYVFLDDDTTYEAQLDRLIAAVRTDLTWMRTHADLGRSAEEWGRAGRPRGLLLGGTRLRAAEGWIASRPANAPLPTDDTRALIAASRRALRQWRNGLIGALMFGLVLALGLAALALTQRQEAIAQRAVAEQQTELALQRERDAAEQRDAARRNFGIAKGTVDQIIFDLAQGLRQVDGIRTSVLRTVLSRVEAAMARLTSAAPDDPNVQRSRHVMLNEFGQTYLAAGDVPAALAAFQGALDIARDLTRRDPENALWSRDLLVSLLRIGDVKLRVGDSAAALAAYQEGLDIARTRARRHPDNVEHRRDLSFSLNKIGDLKLRTGDEAGAMAAFLEGLEIRRGLLRLDPANAQWQRDLSISLERIGDLKLRIDDAAGALAAHEEALDLRRKLARRAPDNTQGQRDFSFSLFKVGDLKLRAGDAAGALAAYQEGLEIQRALSSRDPANAQWLRDIEVSLGKIGDAKLALGDLAGALAAAEDSRDIARTLARRDPADTGWQSDLSTSLKRLGDFKIRSRDAPGALGAFQEALDVRRALVRRDPDNAEWQTDLVEILLRVASVDQDPRHKHETLDEALAIAIRLEQAGKLSVSRRNWPDLIRAELAKL